MATFEGSKENETRRQRNARWRRDMARYRVDPLRCWTGTEVIWARRLETLLTEHRADQTGDTT